MNTQEIIKSYNQYERIEVTIPGSTKYISPEIVKMVSSAANGSHISYFNLSPADVDAAIKAELEFFTQRKSSFEWKTYDTDMPSNIGERLLAHGFEKGEPESFMVLELDSIAQFFDESEGVVEVTDLAGIKDAIDVQQQVWGGDMSGQLAHLIASKNEVPENISIYLVYENEKPVTSGWIVYNGDSPFAGIWGGSTLDGFRGKGYYSALLHKRINDAKARGKKYLTIDASEMSRPIVEKHGFRRLAITTPYMFDPAKAVIFDK
jgi:hypothetical protein